MGFKQLILAMSALFFCSHLSASDLKIGIMKSKRGAAAKYTPLISYFKAKDIKVKLVSFKDYRDAAQKFLDGKVDAMFAGSGVAGTLLIKDLAYPVVRPESKEGWSDYWAVVVAPKGSDKFDGNKKYFDNKKITCSPLASSGEFWVRTIIGTSAKLLYAKSHGDALNKLSKKQADIAIVKNRVWDSVKSKYPSLAVVGQDSGKNPNGTLIASKKADKKMIEKVKGILLNLKSDTSNLAESVRIKMQAAGFIPTAKSDFDHTIKMLSDAGVDKNFQFKYTGH